MTNAWAKIPALSASEAAQAASDLALIVRGEELDLPWRRLRVLFDHGFVRISQPVLTGGALRGSITSLEWTEEGSKFMSAGG